MNDDFDAEIAEQIKEKIHWRSRAIAAESKVVRLEGRVPAPGGAAKFVKRAQGEHDTSIGKVDEPTGFRDAVTITWTINAVLAGLAYGPFTRIDGEQWTCWPASVIAQNWWHLCSILGCTEGVARLFYFHPEASQPLATGTVASGCSDKVRVYCQGDD